MRLSRSTFPVLFLLVFSTFAHALSTRAVGGTLYVNEVPVLTLRSHVGGSPAKRCAQLAAKLAPVSSQSEARVSRSGRSYKVLVGATAISVKKAEAKAAGTTPGRLAGMWAARMRSALALPALKVSATTVLLPPGGVKAIALVGREALRARIEAATVGVAQISRAPGVMRVKATAVGKTELVVLGPTGSATISVQVLPWAAKLPQDLTVSVTGSPATREIVRGAVERALKTQLRTVKECWVSFTIPRGKRLQSSESGVFPVKVKVGGSQCFQVEGTARVTVKNLGLGAKSEAELWYCNDPESIRRYGNLFAAELKRDKPARLLFHHINESQAPLTVEIRAVNGSDQPARVVIIPGETLPDKNPVLAGARAGDAFMRNWVCGSGEVVWLPPHSSIPISMQRLSLQETTSGLCYLRLLADGPQAVFVRADAREPGLEDRLGLETAPWRRIRPAPAAMNGKNQPALNDHIYPNPFRHEKVVYAVGGKHGFVFVGEKPIERADQLKKLDGNFGVVYTIDAQVTNPTQLKATVEIVFQASTGYSGGLFVVDGRLVRCPMNQPPGGFRIWSDILEPGAAKTCRILTIPLSGSAYPVTITVRTPDALGSAATP